MNDREATIRFIEALEQASIPYMVVGSLSSIVYGLPRSTKDVDVVASLSTGQLPSLLLLLGNEFRLDAQITFETHTGTTRRVIRLSDSEFTLELFQLSRDPFDQARFARRSPVFLHDLNRKVIVQSAEDVVIMKLRWGRPKDIDDVRGVLAVRQEKLDWDYITHWADQHGTRTTLAQLQASVEQFDNDDL